MKKRRGLRTYTAAMADLEYQLVWHMDYADHVDEETLYGSFEKFAERIDFKIFGITKDKWKPSANALKKAIKKLWIGFCRRHCLKKKSGIICLNIRRKPDAAIRKGKKYRDFQKVLDSASSQNSLNVKLNLLKNKAFNHPLLSLVLSEVKKNAVL